MTMIKSQIIKKLKGCKLGLRRQTLSLSNHQSEWSAAYIFISHLLKISVANIETFHIGSTAVNTIKAKPILDILLTFKNEKDFSNQIQKIEDLGFLHKGAYGVEGRHFFTFYCEKAVFDFAHVHAFHFEHSQVKKLLYFRDRLNSDPSMAKKYEELKAELVAKNIPRKDYPEAKTIFVNSVTKISDPKN